MEGGGGEGVQGREGGRWSKGEGFPPPAGMKIKATPGGGGGAKWWSRFASWYFRLNALGFCGDVPPDLCGCGAVCLGRGKRGAPQVPSAPRGQQTAGATTRGVGLGPCPRPPPPPEVLSRVQPEVHSRATSWVLEEASVSKGFKTCSGLRTNRPKAIDNVNASPNNKPTVSTNVVCIG